jgi:hypothetical protein
VVLSIRQAQDGRELRGKRTYYCSAETGVRPQQNPLTRFAAPEKYARRPPIFPRRPPIFPPTTEREPGSLRRNCWLRCIKEWQNVGFSANWRVLGPFWQAYWPGLWPDMLKLNPCCGTIDSVAYRSTDYEVKWEIPV